MVKDIGVKISKRKSTNSFLSFDDVSNDINDWLAEQIDENYELNMMNYVVKKNKLTLTQARRA